MIEEYMKTTDAPAALASLLAATYPGIDGWTPAGETWTYASADAPTYTFTISGDKTTKYYPGMRIKLTDAAAVKYFIITKVAYGAPNTTITVYGGTDYTLAGGAISLPYYSMLKAPAGFPTSPIKWTVEVTDAQIRSQSSPVVGTWYNLGTILISIPIGIWWVSYACLPEAVGTTLISVYVSLSTANNSESDTDRKSVV
jgi:hypothetical protein